MRFAGRNRLLALGVSLLVLACGGDGGGGTAPPGPPADLVRSGVEHQDWFFNNPLPAPYSVTVRDANNRAVPGVSVDWAFTTGGGSLSENPSTTNSSGVATTVHTLGTATTYVVTATVTGLPSATFSASASEPPKSATVEVDDNVFRPASFVIQKDSAVTWSWVGGLDHNVTFIGGPTPRPTTITDRTTGSVERRIALVGTYNYTCTNHGGMNGSVTVVN